MTKEDRAPYNFSKLKGKLRGWASRNNNNTRASTSTRPNNPKKVHYTDSIEVYQPEDDDRSKAETLADEDKDDPIFNDIIQRILDDEDDQ
ncbi:Uu.00g059610.m01.CDS01 [Anthostomella pinea]|uniref:Uu.00g059610.m01.CDS01 n=1 Tax=Anthostomella pinea TaxID=933095 RepID=A0AAI8VS18_9PEZI|nr:Uu.00g059610.m01.CDS01 [Anthostomella pinea]